MLIANEEDAHGAPVVPRPAASGGAAWGRIRPAERPPRLGGLTERRETPLGTLFLTLNALDGRPFGLFAQIGKAGSDVAAFTEAIARLVSLTLRSGVDPAEVAEQLADIGGSHSVGFGTDRVRSVPDAIGQVLRQTIQDGSDDLPSEVAAALNPAQDRHDRAAATVAFGRGDGGVPRGPCMT